MRRSFALPAIAIVSAIIITMGTGAIADALSGAGDEVATEAQDAAAAAPAATATPAAGDKKPLHSIPEDGEAVGAFEFVPKWLRDLFASRPNEDLIVCLAGCAPNRDRVVYARLKEVPDVAPVAAAPKPVEEKTAPVADVKPATKPDEKDAAVNADAPAFIPTFNLPLDRSDDAKDGAPAKEPAAP